MAVRIHHSPRRRRRATAELAEVSSVLLDESALLESVERTVDQIDEATAGA